MGVKLVVGTLQSIMMMMMTISRVC